MDKLQLETVVEIIKYSYAFEPSEEDFKDDAIPSIVKDDAITGVALEIIITFTNDELSAIDFNDNYVRQFTKTARWHLFKLIGEKIELIYEELIQDEIHKG